MYNGATLGEMSRYTGGSPWAVGETTQGIIEQELQKNISTTYKDGIESSPWATIAPVRKLERFWGNTELGTIGMDHDKLPVVGEGDSRQPLNPIRDETVYNGPDIRESELLPTGEECFDWTQDDVIRWAKSVGRLLVRTVDRACADAFLAADWTNATSTGAGSLGTLNTALGDRLAATLPSGATVPSARYMLVSERDSPTGQTSRGKDIAGEIRPIVMPELDVEEVQQ